MKWKVGFVVCFFLGCDVSQKERPQLVGSTSLETKDDLKKWRGILGEFCLNKDGMDWCHDQIKAMRDGGINLSPELIRSLGEEAASIAWLRQR